MPHSNPARALDADSTTSGPDEDSSFGLRIVNLEKQLSFQRYTGDIATIHRERTASEARTRGAQKAKDLNHG